MLTAVTLMAKLVQEENYPAQSDPSEGEQDLMDGARYQVAESLSY